MGRFDKVLTKKMFHLGSTDYCGHGYNRKQIEFLGLKYPPKSGWTDKVIGDKFPEETLNKFLNLRGNISSKTKKIYKKKARTSVSLELYNMKEEEWKIFKALCKKHSMS